MAVCATVTGERWQVRYGRGVHTGIADTHKLGVGGDGGLRPHELLEAALASCMTITARMYLTERGLDATGVSVEVDVERGAGTCFRCVVDLPPELDHVRGDVMAALEASPVRETLSKPISFQVTGK